MKRKALSALAILLPCFGCALNVAVTPPDQIQRRIFERREQYESCFKNATGSDHEINGTLIAIFYIENDGNVKNVEFDREKSTFHNDQAESCIAAALKETSFPAQDNYPERVTFPFSVRKNQ